MPEIAGKRVLVTGACGTVGAELVRQLLGREQNAPEEVIGLDNNESDLFFLDQEYVADLRARFFVADIRDRDELARRMRGVDYGYEPEEIETQVIGTKPGEKLYEELPRYFAVLPAFRGIYHDIPYDYPEVVSDEVTNPYVSAREPAESPEHIQAFLERNRLLGEPAEETARRYWPGDREEKDCDPRRRRLPRLAHRHAPFSPGPRRPNRRAPHLPGDPVGLKQTTIEAAQ